MPTPRIVIRLRNGGPLKTPWEGRKPFRTVQSNGLHGHRGRQTRNVYGLPAPKASRSSAASPGRARLSGDQSRCAPTSLVRHGRYAITMHFPRTPCSQPLGHDPFQVPRLPLPRDTGAAFPCGRSAPRHDHGHDGQRHSGSGTWQTRPIPHFHVAWLSLPTGPAPLASKASSESGKPTGSGVSVFRTGGHPAGSSSMAAAANALLRAT